MIQHDYGYYENLDTVIKEAIDFISKSVDLNTIFVAMNNSKTNHVIRAFNRSAVLLSDGDRHPFQDVLCSLVVNSGQDALAVANLKNDPLTAEHPVTKQYSTGSFIGVPIRLGTETVGTLCAFDLQPHSFSEQEIQLFRMFSLLLTQSINLENGLIRDNLTNFFNRTFVHGFLSYHPDPLDNMSVIYLDVDNFKTTNDTFGHEFGDHVIREAAKRLDQVISAEHFTARLGGDEFVILLPNLPEGSPTEKITEEIISSFRNHPITVDGQELFLTVSAGISLYPQDGEDMETLLRQADLAMYKVKFSGRSNYRFYSEDILEESSRSFKIRNGLRSALTRGELDIHYQPQFNLKTGELMGTEALLRWRHPELGSVSPAEFIPVAEEMGYICEFSRWGMAAASRQYTEWLKAGLEPGTLSVNLSPVLFRRQQLTENVQLVLEKTGLPPERFHVEITESVIMQDGEQALKTLNAFKEMGIWVALDDFGTGYSSLNYLSKYPIDVLKIDRSLTATIAESAGKKVAKAVLSLAESLDLHVVAEGIETAEELAFYEENNCGFGQGYLFSKPLPAGEMEEFLRTHTNNLSLTR